MNGAPDNPSRPICHWVAAGAVEDAVGIRRRQLWQVFCRALGPGESVVLPECRGSRSMGSSCASRRCVSLRRVGAVVVGVVEARRSGRDRSGTGELGNQVVLGVRDPDAAGGELSVEAFDEQAAPERDVCLTGPR
jgi:hypothetical protein